MLNTLRSLGIGTLMVEGGAQVIATFMDDLASRVDRLVVTTAPVIVGRDGKGYHPRCCPALEPVAIGQLGRDTVTGLRVA